MSAPQMMAACPKYDEQHCDCKGCMHAKEHEILGTAGEKCRYAGSRCPACTPLPAAEQECPECGRQGRDCPEYAALAEPPPRKTARERIDEEYRRPDPTLPGVCDHGQLRRACPLCEADEDARAAERVIAAADAREDALRGRVEFLARGAEASDYNHINMSKAIGEAEKEIAALRAVDAGHRSRIDGLKTRVEVLTQENEALRAENGQEIVLKVAACNNAEHFRAQLAAANEERDTLTRELAVTASQLAIWKESAMERKEKVEALQFADAKKAEEPHWHYGYVADLQEETDEYRERLDRMVAAAQSGNTRDYSAEALLIWAVEAIAAIDAHMAQREVGR